MNNKNGDNGFDTEINEWHCFKCGRFLGYEGLISGIVVIMCPRCKFFNVLNTLDITVEVRDNQIEVTRHKDLQVT